MRMYWYYAYKATWYDLFQNLTYSAALTWSRNLARNPAGGSRRLLPSSYICRSFAIVRIRPTVYSLLVVRTCKYRQMILNKVKV
jgi:hypothetical protein